MIIGKPLTALGGGGLKPEIRVTAKAGALLNLYYKDSSIILQSYKLGASETTHTFVVSVSETAYVVEDATNGKSMEVLVDAISVFDVAIKYGILASNFSEGSIVKVNENGSPVDFYVAKHDYESGLNGAGRILLVRKNCYDTRQWNSSYNSAYASSTIDSWLNGSYKSLLDQDVQNIIGQTRFYYAVGNGDSTVIKLERSIFLLSTMELGKKAPMYDTTVGSTLPIASTLQVAYINGNACKQWTRSPYLRSGWEGAVFFVQENSEYDTAATAAQDGIYGSRPVFTIPSTALFDEETHVLKGVS